MSGYVLSASIQERFGREPIEVADLGNDQLKAVNSFGTSLTIPNALLPITVEEYNTILNQPMLDDDQRQYAFKVGTAYYKAGPLAVIGGKAVSRTGSDRYQADYLPILFAIMCRLMHESSKSLQNVTATITHPPGNGQYAKDITKLIKGKHRVTNIYGTLTIEVARCLTLEEGTCGVYNLILNSGTEVIQSSLLQGLLQGSTAVLDFGGHNIAATQLLNGQYHNFRVAYQAGILEFRYQLEQLIRSHLKREEGISLDVIPNWLMDSILATGVVSTGTGSYNVKALIDGSVQSLLAVAEGLLAEIGGTANTNLVFTGGGTGLLHDYLRKDAFGFRTFYFAGDPEEIRFANAYGALKLTAHLLRKG